jgi:hypothetical protein
MVVPLPLLCQSQSSIRDIQGTKPQHASKWKDNDHIEKYEKAA